MSGTKGRKLPTSADVSEQPKVVHEYEAVGTKIRVTEEDGKHLRWMLHNGDWCCDPTEDADELARLAARVEELLREQHWNKIAIDRLETSNAKLHENCESYEGLVPKLEARIKELEEDIAGWKSDYNDVCEDCTKEENHRASLESENTRLREALAEYGHHKGGCDFAPCSCGILAALNEKPASVFGRDPMNAPDVTDILEEKP